MQKLILSITLLFTITTISPLLSQKEKTAKYWVFFKAKEAHSLQKASQAALAKQFDISEKALKRRSKVLSPNNLIDNYDLPVDAQNIRMLLELGLQPTVQSKWLNAVSINLTTVELATIKNLSFVKMVRPVAKGTLPPAPEAPVVDFSLQKKQTHELDYGNSLTQNELINVPAVHDFGITGEGIIIGLIDSGFRHNGHEAFQNLKLLGEFDFINNDEVTENQTGQDRSDQDEHGTWTLSLIAGFKEGQLIGAAFDADILLAKTEFVPTETSIEEDFWVAGIEWLESQGTDVVSSSLGYTNFSDVSFYDQSDMDGNTAVTTIAADIAAKKGIVVVISAGNDGSNSWGIIAAPADADSVITVGAVDSGNRLASFSSRGPTADGRTKPDVVAMGVTTYLADPSTDPANSKYTARDGTSFACPSVAGVAGLILAAHPNLTPLQVRNALRSTADNSFTPNNDIGWGLVDAYRAILFHGPAFSTKPEITKAGDAYTIQINADSKNGVDANEVYFGYQFPGGETAKEEKMTADTELNSFQISLPDSVLGDSFQYYFKLTDQTGITAYHPNNAPTDFFTFTFSPSSVEGGDSSNPEIFQLAQNFPNPFNPGTKINFELKVSSKTSLTIYNTLGQKIKLLENKSLPVGQHKYFWNGTDENGRQVVSGVYFYRLAAGKFSQVKKMIVIK